MSALAAQEACCDAEQPAFADALHEPEVPAGAAWADLEQQPAATCWAEQAEAFLTEAFSGHALPDWQAVPPAQAAPAMARMSPAPSNQRRLRMWGSSMGLWGEGALLIRN